jgi:hypothetical protein
MPPPITANDMTDQLLTNAILTGYRALAYAAGCVALPYGPYIGLGQFCLWQVRSSYDTLRMLAQRALIAFVGAAFARRVFHIFFACAEKQMIRANTAGVITGVTHIKPIGDWAVMNQPGCTMRENNSIITPTAPKLSIRSASFHAVASPEPAPIGLLDFGPKAIGERCTRARAARLCGRLGAHIKTPLMCHASGC